MRQPVSGMVTSIVGIRHDMNNFSNVLCEAAVNYEARLTHPREKRGLGKGKGPRKGEGRL